MHLRNLALGELEEMMSRRQEPPYRWRQLAYWIYAKLASGFSPMTDLPKSLRAELDGDFVVEVLREEGRRLAPVDGTCKYLFVLPDGERVEAVILRHEGRTTLCISTQVGCPLGCRFCRTGQGGFKRNLTAGEILDQVAYLKREAGLVRGKVNVVFMGMGEPMLNYSSLVRAIAVMNHPLGFNLGSKRLTVSTAGIPATIRALAEEGLKCSLALSLNAATDQKRAELMPALARYQLSDLMRAALYFYRRTKRRVTIEYVLLGGVNTSEEDARRLAELTARGPFKINLIPYNAVPCSPFRSPGEDEIERFLRTLLPSAPAVTVRRSKGAEIEAACGQLWTASLDKKNPAKGSEGCVEEGFGG